MENWEYRKMRGTDKPCTGKIYNKPIDLRKKGNDFIRYTDHKIQGGSVKRRHMSQYDQHVSRSDKF